MTAAPALTVGTELVPVTLPAISRATLALYAGASGDHNPVHIDLDFARSAGFDDVFVHGMLVMGYLGRFVSQSVPQRRLLGFSTRFVAVTHVGDRLTCKGTVAQIITTDSGRAARLTLAVIDQHQQMKITGEALLEVT
jgi:acyl dehydratase